MVLASCRPVYGPSSSEETSSVDTSTSEEVTSEEISSSSEEDTSSEIEHHYSNDWSHDNTHHWHACIDEGYTDLKKDYSEHTFTESITKAATYDEAGILTHSCFCGYSYTTEIPQLVHNYSNEWSSNSASHWHACTDAGYTDLKKDEGSHDFVFVETVEPTPTEQGYSIYKCSTCEYIKYDDFVDPTGEHHYSSDWSHDNEYHWHACTDEGCDSTSDYGHHNFVESVITPASYTAPGLKRYTCNVCSYYYEEAIPQLVHHYSSDWSHNNTHHWHACTDIGYTDLKKDESTHTYSVNVVTPASYTAPGLKRYTCNICGYSYDEEIPQLVHTYASEWSHDETKHWHACLDEGYSHLKGDEALHSFNSPVFNSDPNYSIYKKGVNVYTCSVCGYKKEEIVYYTKAEMATLMNEYIEDKIYFDVFEIRDDLILEGFPVVDFAYDLSNGNIVISNPTNEALVSFKETKVSTLIELKDAISAIATGADYSVINVLNDLDVDETISINSSKPIQINLKGHTLNNLQEELPCIRLTRGNLQKPMVALTNGKIQTPDLSGFNLEKRSSCVMMLDAESLRLSDLTLDNRAERGYAYIDYPENTTNAKVMIRDCTITSKVVALCIQANTNVIMDNNIQGVVVVNSGHNVIKNNVIDATNVQKGLESEATRLITCTEFYIVCKDVYPVQGYDGFMITSTDAILIFDRRSVNGTYPSPQVVISDNILKCKLGEGNNPLGYGIRYLDLAFDASISENGYSKGYIMIESNTYSYCEDEPFMNPGGYIIYEADSVV